MFNLKPIFMTLILIQCHWARNNTNHIEFDDTETVACLAVMCPDGKPMNQNCECIPDSCAEESCPAGQTFSKEECKCVFKACLTVLCPDGKPMNDNCECIPDSCAEESCPDDHIWSTEECKCRPKNCEPLVCSPAEIWNPEDCACIPYHPCGDIPECPPHQVFHSAECRCIGNCFPEKCPPKHYWVQDDCKCVESKCDFFSVCDFGFKWNEADCNCVIFSRCPPGFTFSEDLLTCVQDSSNSEPILENPDADSS